MDLESRVNNASVGFMGIMEAYSFWFIKAYTQSKTGASSPDQLDKLELVVRQNETEWEGQSVYYIVKSKENGDGFEQRVQVKQYQPYSPSYSALVWRDIMTAETADGLLKMKCTSDNYKSVSLIGPAPVIGSGGSDKNYQFWRFEMMDGRYHDVDVVLGEVDRQ